MAGEWMLLPVEIILSHENADFDALASMLGAHRLFPSALPVLARRVNRNVTGFLTLYRSALPFITREELPARRISRVILTDAHQLPPIRGVTPRTEILVIDHHPPADTPDPRMRYESEIIGATSTLIVERVRAVGLTLPSLEATLLALGIYEDTGSLSYSSTTPRDLQAAAWLVEEGAVLETVRRFLDPPLSPEQQALYEVFVRSLRPQTIEGYTVMVGGQRVAQVPSEIRSVAHRLMDTFDPTALFLVIQSPEMTNVVARSRDDAVDVGAIARTLGGGGHVRAAAAVLHDGRPLEAIVEQLLQQAAAHIRASDRIERVRDLMSHGAQAFQAEQRLVEIAPLTHRLGHEGYPVLDGARVVGVLNRREVDRALEHALTELRVRDVMVSGDVALRPEATLTELEKKMVQADIGQVPVIDGEGRLLGIVTRTDLIRHWVRQHPDEDLHLPLISRAEMASVLGEATADLIAWVGAQITQHELRGYLVGGVVRDLLLERRNLDLDFVLDGDAIAFAAHLQAAHGGRLQTHAAFGTAKWTPDDAFAAAHGWPRESLPPAVDFVSARNEYYTAPSALPTVYQGSIKLDLRRRDFTINTLALSVTPGAGFGEIVDYFGGLADLRAGTLRVLHSLSFVDDPTRILRAVRFEHRLNFTIDARTAALSLSAAPMLRRVSGERIAHEFDLLLEEETPERALLALAERGILAAVHPQLTFTTQAAEAFERARGQGAPSAGLPELYLHLWFALQSSSVVDALAGRLVYSRARARSLQDAQVVAALLPRLATHEMRPSEVAWLLDGCADVALQAALVLAQDGLAQERLTRYREVWRGQHPVSGGAALAALGLKPGPCYGELLRRLRAAILDGELPAGAESERAALARWIREGACDDAG